WSTILLSIVLFRAVWTICVVHVALFFMKNLGLFVDRVGAPLSADVAIFWPAYPTISNLHICRLSV
ncbi:MAG: hypothetical protein ACI9C3_000466, partial [Yoonia sp.]